jgi:hypothetical protein
MKLIQRVLRNFDPNIGAAADERLSDEQRQRLQAAIERETGDRRPESGEGL